MHLTNATPAIHLTVLELKLKECDLLDKHVKEIANNIFPKTPNIKTLGLNFNGNLLTKESIDFLLEKHIPKLTLLVDLSLSFRNNKKIGLSGPLAIQSGCKGINTRLYHLSIDLRGTGTESFFETKKIKLKRYISN